MLRPFLMIGLGGSGGKTLRAVRADAMERLKKVGISDWPDAWQFLYIDVPTSQEVGDVETPPLKTSEYIGLVPPGIDYTAVDNTLVQQAGGASNLSGWRPNPNLVNVPISQGAGQHRTIGRVITVTHLGDIRDRVQRCIDAIRMPTVVDQLATITRAMGGAEKADAPPPVVIVIASIAGGSGAGSLIDVCDVVRAVGQDNWASHSAAVLYAPDVFGEIPREARAGVQANALATVSEILAGYWNERGHSAATTNLMQRSGILPTGSNRHGPNYSFLVGRRNSEISFAGQKDVYLAMGKALGALLTSGELQGQYTEFVTGNWEATNKAVHDALPLKQQGQTTPFSAFGFARLSLGRDRFGRYAAEWLARAAVERLLREHAPPEDSAVKAEQVLLDAAVQRAFPRFRHDTRLHEKGLDNDDVLDALRPSDRTTRSNQVGQTYLREVLGNVDEKGLPAREWQNRIQNSAKKYYLVFDQGENAELAKAVSDWVGDIQDRVLEETRRAVGRHGAPVAAGLLRRMADELGAAVDELQNEAREREDASSRFGEELARLLPGGKDAVPPQNRGIADAVQEVVKAFGYAAEANLRRVAVELIRDLIEHYLRPLEKAIQYGYSGLLHEETAGQGASDDPSTWPEGEAVPQRMKPWANEFLLEGVDGYRRALTEQVLRTLSTEGRADIRESESKAIAEIVEGVSPTDYNAEKDDPIADPWKWLVHARGSWVPAVSSLHLSLGSPRPAQFTVSMSAEDVLERATEWVQRPGRPIGQYVSESLGDYLDPEAAGVDPSEHARRMQGFTGMLVATIKAARPLVDINPGVLSEVHNQKTVPTTTTFTGIPFHEASPAALALKEVLTPMGSDLWDRAKDALTDHDESHVDVFSFSARAYEPAVFDSVVQPIGAQWNEVRHSAHGRSEFWRYRRARPLPEFVPLATGVRLAMIRGWFTARLLGQTKAALDRPTEIWVPSGPGVAAGFARFPYPLLGGDLHEGYDLLPMILKTMPLALVEVNLGNRTAMTGYSRLRDLGRDPRNDAGRFDEYRNLNSELEDWLMRGVVTTGAPLPDSADAGSPQDEPTVRQAATLARVQTWQADYGELFEQAVSQSETSRMPLVVELEDDFRVVFEELTAALGAELSAARKRVERW